MNPQARPNDDPQPTVTPSDEDLLVYLLGSASHETRGQVERWLAVDVSHGERLSTWASVVLCAAQAIADPLPASGSPLHSQPAPVSTTASPAVRRWRSRRYRVAGVLALAASVLVAAFVRDGFRDPAPSDGRVAMAWADSLPVKRDAVVESELSNWLLEPGGPLDASDVPAFHDFSGEDEGGSVAAFGFTEEPPEWLLAAVSEMQSSDPEPDTGEGTL